MVRMGPRWRSNQCPL
ncbi:hypothetical protein MAR_025865 [Mya arenaria]|uniref:Uncharacterized protein n=1 Tax=Mya arenaria TaxID=6604 RepID=A0ABY7EPA5_MYAAR|nr:hypothetical protein MAR_025865 [Mya arenaria]